MYKIIILIIKYVKLAIYNEIICYCKELKSNAQRGIDYTNNDMQKNFFGGEIRAYNDVVCVLQERVRILREEK